MPRVFLVMVLTLMKLPAEDLRRMEWPMLSAMVFPAKVLPRADSSQMPLWLLMAELSEMLLLLEESR